LRHYFLDLQSSADNPSRSSAYESEVKSVKPRSVDCIYNVEGVIDFVQREE